MISLVKPFILSSNFADVFAFPNYFFRGVLIPPISTDSLVVEYDVAIVVARVQFPVGAFFSFY